MMSTGRKSIAFMSSTQHEHRERERRDEAVRSPW